jgi:hypothetical protein
VLIVFRRSLLVVPTLLAIFAVRPALAQPAAAASEALFRAGREAMQQGDARTACAKFRESYRLEHAPGTLLNIGVCEEALGELSNAWQHYQDLVHALPPDDDRLRIARQHSQQLDPRLPRLTVHLAAGAPEDTRALIGSVELGAASFDTALPMDPGHYDVRVTAAGRESQTSTLDLSEGERTQIEIAPGEVLPEPPEPEPATQSAAGAGTLGSDTARAPSDAGATTPPWRNAIAYGLLGASGAGLLVAVVTGAFALDRAATVDAHCPDKRCDSEGLTATRSGQTLYIVSLTSLGVGVAAAGAGLYLLLVPPKNEHGGLAFAPALSPQQLGVRVSGQL